MKPLIFQRLSLQWEDLKLPQPHTFHWPEDGELRSFPLPGYPAGQDLSAIEIRPDGLTFPAYGVYSLTGPFGVAKLLLLDPAADDDDHILAISRFVSAASYYSGVDTYLRYGGATGPNCLTPFVQKLFYSDQPIGLMCAEVADVLAFVLHLSGHVSRKLQLRNDTDVTHWVLEVYFPTARHWTIVDLTYDVVLVHRGNHLSAAEVLCLRAAGKTAEIEIVPLARRVSSSRYFPGSSTGQVTWTPDDFDGWHACQDSYYRDAIVDRGFRGVEYYGYAFDAIARNTVLTTVTTTKIDGLSGIVNLSAPASEISVRSSTAGRPATE